MNINQFAKYDEDVWILPTLEPKDIQTALCLVDSDRKAFGKWIIDNFKAVRQEKNIPNKRSDERFWCFNYKLSDLNHFREMIRLRFRGIEESQFMPPNTCIGGKILKTKAHQLAEVNKVVENFALDCLCFLLSDFAQYNLKANLICARVPNLPRRFEIDVVLREYESLSPDFQKKLIEFEDNEKQHHPHQITKSLIKEQLENSIESISQQDNNNILNSIDYLYLN